MIKDPSTTSSRTSSWIWVPLFVLACGFGLGCWWKGRGQDKDLARALTTIRRLENEANFVHEQQITQLLSLAFPESEGSRLFVHLQDKRFLRHGSVEFVRDKIRFELWKEQQVLLHMTCEDGLLVQVRNAEIQKLQKGMNALQAWKPNQPESKP